MIDGDNAKVMLKIYNQETHGHLLFLGKVSHNLGTKDDITVLTGFKLV